MLSRSGFMVCGTVLKKRGTGMIKILCTIFVLMASCQLCSMDVKDGDTRSGKQRGSLLISDSRRRTQRSSTQILSASPSVMAHGQEQSGTWIGVTKSVEEADKHHKNGTALFMQAHKEYLEKLQERDISNLKPVLLIFYQACDHYLHAWECGDPTAESGCERSLKCANLILRLLHDQQRNTSVFEMPEQHFIIYEKIKKMREKDINVFGGDGNKLLREVLQKDQSARASDVKEAYRQGHAWYEFALTDHGCFIAQRVKYWPDFVNESGWAAHFYMQSFEAGHLKSLERLVDVLDRAEPKKWGYDAWPEVEGKQQLSAVVKKLNDQFAVEGTEITIPEYKAALKSLQALELKSARQSSKDIFSPEKAAAGTTDASLLPERSHSSSNVTSKSSGSSTLRTECAKDLKLETNAQPKHSEVPGIEFHPSDSRSDNVPPDQPSGERKKKVVTPRHIVQFLRHPKGGPKQ